MKRAIYAFINFICTIVNVIGWVLAWKANEYGWATVSACLAGSCFILMLWNIKETNEWHYLVKDPKDLPKKEGLYWVCVRDGRYKEDGSWEWISKPLCKTAVWLDAVFGTAGGPPVIAWCELPVYDKEYL